MPLAALASVLALLSVASPPASAAEPARLDLARLFVAVKGAARVAPEVEALRGRRVRVVGFMARMEEAPRGAFYLTRLPVEADESGAGTADLPPQAVRVEVPGLAGAEVDWVPGLVEAVGTLQVGRAEDPEGRVSWLRVVLDTPAPTPARAAAPGAPSQAPAPIGGRSHP